MRRTQSAYLLLSVLTVSRWLCGLEAVLWAHCVFVVCSYQTCLNLYSFTPFVEWKKTIICQIKYVINILIERRTHNVHLLRQVSRRDCSRISVCCCWTTSSVPSLVSSSASQLYFPSTAPFAPCCVLNHCIWKLQLFRRLTTPLSRFSTPPLRQNQFSASGARASLSQLKCPNFVLPAAIKSIKMKLKRFAGCSCIQAAIVMGKFLCSNCRPTGIIW